MHKIFIKIIISFFIFKSSAFANNNRIFSCTCNPYPFDSAAMDPVEIYIWQHNRCAVELFYLKSNDNPNTPVITAKCDHELWWDKSAPTRWMPLTFAKNYTEKEFQFSSKTANPDGSWLEVDFTKSNNLIHLQISGDKNLFPCAPEVWDRIDRSLYKCLEQ